MGRIALYLALCCVSCSALAATCLPQSERSRVAVIGGGVGGAFTAALLYEELGTSSSIDVFEAEAIGGRTRVAFVDGEAIEMGASIFCELNYYTRNWTDRLGLQRVPVSGGSSKGPDTPLAIYDGQQFVFNESSWSAVTLYRMLRRYGLSYWYFKAAPQTTAQRFLRYYQLQQAGMTAKTPRDLLQAVDLYQLTQHTFQEDMQRQLGTGRAAMLFIDELLAAINRVNYNQADLNALAGTVSMFPFVDDRLYHVEGGNFRLAVELLKHLGAQVHVPARVAAVQCQADGRYSISLASGGFSMCDQREADNVYDAVVIATPLENSTLQLLGFDKPVIPARQFKRTVTTIVSGRLQPSYFGVRRMPAGETVMVTAAAQTPFSSISALKLYANGTRLYKVFSSKPITEDLLSSLFVAPVVHAVHDWHAYPVFHVPEQFAPFQLAEGLYYGNAWENAASAMEMSAVAAGNSALLVKQHLLKAQDARPQRQHNSSVDSDGIMIA